MDDQQQPSGSSEPVVLDGPRELPPLLPAEVIAACAAIKTRRRLRRSAVYQEHGAALQALTHALLHRPAPAPAVAGPGDFVRVVSWNIKRGIHLDGILTYLHEHEDLRRLDILLLNEVDLGMRRSGNRHVAEELARSLGFAYVYGVSYLCLGFGDRCDGVPTGANREGLHGNAILSRFPIRRAESFSVAITKDKFQSSEKRLGHKKALWAEIETPRGLLPVVAVHLDSNASSRQRGAQLQDVLEKIEQRRLGDRVLLGGDLNTTTYDIQSTGQLLGNLARKLLRGGFPHAIYHYLHPEELYERPVFAALEARGFDYRGCNAMGVGTTRYEVGSFDSESTVREQLPELAVKILRVKLRPWNGVAALKLDWFAGRGLEVLPDAAVPRPGGAASRAPTPILRPTVGGTQLSDHDPILVDLRF